MLTEGHIDIHLATISSITLPPKQLPFPTHPVTFAVYYTQGLAAFGDKTSFLKDPSWQSKNKEKRESLLGVSHHDKAPRQI